MRPYAGFAIALAWPETLCKQAGAWYDPLMHKLKINQKGYYRVGHAAIVLINNSGECFYFDFGRYHAPTGYGRVRGAITDHDLIIKSKAIISVDGQQIVNLKEILTELLHNPSTHGDGAISGKLLKIDYQKTINYICQQQQKDFIPYGPFIAHGTNCSRFVNNALRIGSINFTSKLLLRSTLSPSPMWNLRAIPGPTIRIDKPKATEERTAVFHHQYNIKSA